MQIYFPFKGFSVNTQFYANRKFGHTKEFKEWSYQVNHRLRVYAADFEALRKEFDPARHGLSVSMIFYYKNFFNKSGSISHKTFDCSNCEKSLLDLCIDAAHHGKAPYMSPNLNLNDTYVIELFSKKTPGESDGVLVDIKIVELPTQLDDLVKKV